MLERKHVAVARNGWVRIKKTGEEIGRVDAIRVYGVPGTAWQPHSPFVGGMMWCSYREEAVEDVIRAYNEREGA